MKWKKTRVGLFLCNQLLLLCTQKTRHLRGDNCARVNVAVPAYAKSKIHTQLPFQTNIPQYLISLWCHKNSSDMLFGDWHAVWLISCLCLLAFKKNLQSVNCAFETSDNHMEAWLSMCTVKIQKEKWDIAVWEETITYKPKRGRHSSTECHPNLKVKQQKTNWLLRIPSENPTFQEIGPTKILIP